MWYTMTARMPYYGDPDYRQSMVTSIKSLSGGALVDITLLETYGRVEVDLPSDQEQVLRQLSLIQIGQIQPSSGSRGIIRDEDRIIV